MTQSTSHWHINPHASNEEAYAILAQDVVWNCFALTDLEPPLRQYSQFATAHQHESNQHAICLILRHPIIGQVLSPFGNAEGIAALLSQIELPEQALIQAQEIHLPALQRYYRSESSWRSMLRMAIPTPISPLQSLAHATHAQVKQLTEADIPALQTLYAQHPESLFTADLFAQSLFCGIYEGEHIIAAGGTYVLTPAHQLAVLGHILTAPDARRQGYATAITATLVSLLVEQHYRTIVLNVFADNRNAIRIYERLGFQTHHTLVAGKAIMHIP